MRLAIRTDVDALVALLTISDHQGTTQQPPASEEITMKTEKKEPRKEPDQPQSAIVTIKKANLIVVALEIEGTSMYVQHKFSAKAKNQIIETQKAGEQARKGKKREPKDFEEVYRGAMHVATDGSHGIPAGGFRAACVSACRIVGFQMTRAKLALFVLADCVDEEGTPLVRITKGEPRMIMSPARNDNGSIDIRARPAWDPGWRATLRVRFDGDIFSLGDVVNMIERVGAQVGVGEGRWDSRNSAGLGWGCFRIVDAATVA